MTPSKAREGLNHLLEHFPDAEVLHVDHQGYHEEIAAIKLGAESLESQMQSDGPWTAVTLRHEKGPVEYAIWNTTGAVYETDQHGAVADDPFLEPTTTKGVVQ